MAELSAGRTVRRVRTGVLGGRASAAPIVFYRLNAVHVVLGADGAVDVKIRARNRLRGRPFCRGPFSARLRGSWKSTPASPKAESVPQDNARLGAWRRSRVPRPSCGSSP